MNTGIVNISNATLLGFDYSNLFLGDGFRYRTNKNVSIEGRIEDFTNTDGVQGIVEGTEAITLALNNDYSEIFINGFSLGLGKINNINFEEGIYVQRTNYSADIEFFESGNLYNMNGDFYPSLQFFEEEISPARLLENFSESFSFNASDDSFNYDHNISLKFVNADRVTASPIDRAKDFATKLFQSNPEFDFIQTQYPDFYIKDYKSYFSEQYDIINNECSFSKTFNSTNLVGNGSIVLRHEYELNEEGVTNVTENGEILGLIEPIGDSALSVLNLEIANSYTRCLNTFNQYKGSNFYDLISTPRQISKFYNEFDGTANYRISFTNDPQFLSTYIWEYTIQISKSVDNGYYTIIENGNIRGLGKPITERYNNAKAGYNIVAAGINSRVSQAYTSSVQGPLTLSLVVKQEERSEYNGTYSYSYTYTDNPAYLGLFKKIEISIEDSLPVDFINKFKIVNYEEMAQKLNSSTLGTRNLSLNIKGFRTTPFNSMLSHAQTVINSNVPNGADVFISDCGYSLNEKENILSLRNAWTYALI